MRKIILEGVIKLGAHESIQGGFHRALERAVADGCQCVQIFTKPPQVWKEPVVPDPAVASFNQERIRTGVSPVIAHDSYLVNPCAAKQEIRRKSVKALLAEAARCERLGIEFLVFHPGSPGDLGEERGIELVADCLGEILRATSRVELLIENTAGQGKSIGYRFEQIGEIIDKAGGAGRLGTCLDTCHAFAAGYDLSTPDSALKTIEELEQAVGTGRLRAIHLNDSKKPRGSRVDRHALIGSGEIGLDLFCWLVNEPRFAELPGVLETPIGKGETYEAEIAKLRSLLSRPTSTA